MKFLLLLAGVAGVASVQLIQTVEERTMEHTSDAPDTYETILAALDGIKVDIEAELAAVQQEAVTRCTGVADTDVTETRTTNTEGLPTSYYDLEGCTATSVCEIDTNKFQTEYLTRNTDYHGHLSEISATTLLVGNKEAELANQQAMWADTKLEKEANMGASEARVQKFDHAISILSRINDGLHEDGSITNPSAALLLSDEDNKVLVGVPLAAAALIMVNQLATMTGPQQAQAVRDLKGMIGVIIANLDASRLAEIPSGLQWNIAKQAELDDIQGESDRLNIEIAAAQGKKESFEGLRDQAKIDFEHALTSSNTMRSACIAGHNIYHTLDARVSGELEAIRQMKALLTTAGLQDVTVAIRDETEETKHGVYESANPGDPWAGMWNGSLSVSDPTSVPYSYFDFFLRMSDNVYLAGAATNQGPSSPPSSVQVITTTEGKVDTLVASFDIGRDFGGFQATRLSETQAVVCVAVGLKCHVLTVTSSGVTKSTMQDMAQHPYSAIETPGQGKMAMTTLTSKLISLCYRGGPNHQIENLDLYCMRLEVSGDTLTASAAKKVSDSWCQSYAVLRISDTLALFVGEQEANEHANGYPGVDASILDYSGSDIVPGKTFPFPWATVDLLRITRAGDSLSFLACATVSGRDVYGNKIMAIDCATIEMSDATSSATITLSPRIPVSPVPATGKLPRQWAGSSHMGGECLTLLNDGWDMSFLGGDNFMVCFGIPVYDIQEKFGMQCGIVGVNPLKAGPLAKIFPGIYQGGSVGMARTEKGDGLIMSTGVGNRGVSPTVGVYMLTPGSP